MSPLFAALVAMPRLPACFLRLAWCVTWHSVLLGLRVSSGCLSLLSFHPPQPEPSQRKFIFQASRIWQRHRPLVSIACVCCERISGFFDPYLDSCRFFQNTKKRVHPVGSFLNFLTISGVRDVLFEIPPFLAECPFLVRGTNN